MIMIMRHSLLYLIFVYWHLVFTEIDIVVLFIAIDNDIMRRSMLRTCYWFLGIVLHLSIEVSNNYLKSQCLTSGNELNESG